MSEVPVYFAGARRAWHKPISRGHDARLVAQADLIPPGILLLDDSHAQS